MVATSPPALKRQGQEAGQAFFVIRGGEGGGEILEEAGTFSGQALLLSYPYPRGGGSSQGGRHPLTALSTVPTSNLFPQKISAWRWRGYWRINYHSARIRTNNLRNAGAAQYH